MYEGIESVDALKTADPDVYAAIEAEDDAGLRELHDWIASRPGVAFVDVVHVNFDDSTTPTPPSHPPP